MELIVLGSAGGAATANRSHPSYLLDLGGEYMMFDCGDGTLMRYQEAKLNINKPLTIFISHLHLDHFGGLASFIRGLGIQGRTNTIVVYHPPSLDFKDIIKTHCECVKFELKFAELHDRLSLSSNNNRFQMLVKENNHRIQSYSFRLEEEIDRYTFDWMKAEADKIPKQYWTKIKKLGQHDGFSIPELKLMLFGSDYQIKNEYKQPRIFCYSGDTEPFEGDKELFMNATLLLHEATYINEHLSEAIKHKHSTALSATRCAIRCKAQYLLLIHRSRRYFPGYENVHMVEATMELGSKHATNMQYEAAQDLMKIDVKLDTKLGLFLFSTRYPDGSTHLSHGDPIRE